MYSTLCDLAVTHKDINQLTIYEVLRTKFQSEKLLKVVLDKLYKGEIVDDIHDSCMRLIDYSVKRQLLDLSSVISVHVKNPMKTGFDVLMDATDSVGKMIAGHTPNSGITIEGLQVETLEMIREAKSFRDKGEFPGVPSGFTKLDSMTGGFKPGQLIITAGRPGMGKTSFVLSAALNAAKRYPVAIFSLEMDGPTLLARLASQYAQIPLEKMMTGDITEHEVSEVGNAISEIQRDYNILIDDDPYLSLSVLQGKVQRYIQQHGVKMIFIDYIQLMQAPKNHNREREVADLSKGMKDIARKFNIPVMILAQLNREVENRNDKKPMLADLRESGSLEQDADLVLFLYRPEYYDIPTYNDQAKTPTTDTCKVIVAKQRNGRVGDVLLTYVKGYTGFYNYIAPGVLPATNHEPLPDAWYDDEKW